VARKFKSLLNLTTLASDPVIGSTGDVYFNTVSKNIKIYNGLTWIELTPASQDPTPFYLHTHTYDGDVHTINVGQPVTFTEINSEEPATPQEEIPVIIGLDGGSPSSIYGDPSLTNLTLLDGGSVDN